MLTNLEGNGRKPVVVVRVKVSFGGHVDFTVYDPEVQKKSDPRGRILGVTPGWQDKDGTITSIETGDIVTPCGSDQVRDVFPGMAFKFQDGAEILYTRNWKRECYFVTENLPRPSERINIKVF